MAAILVVLAAGQALADDSAPTPSADAPPVLLIGGGGTMAADEYEPSLWTDLHRFFSETAFTFGAAPLDLDAAAGADAGYNAFARIDLSGFTFGSRFSQWSEPTFFGEENRSFGLGASYTTESWAVGIDWSRGDYDETILDIDSGEASDVIAFTSSYDLRPGVQINGLLEYSEPEPAATGPTDGALTVGIGTLINF